MRNVNLCFNASFQNTDYTVLVRTITVRVPNKENAYQTQTWHLSETKREKINYYVGTFFRKQSILNQLALFAKSE